MNKPIGLAACLLAVAPSFLAATQPVTLPQLPTDGSQQQSQPEKRYIVLFKQSQTHSRTATAHPVFKDKQFSVTNARRVIDHSGGQVMRELPSIKGLSVRLDKAQRAALANNPNVALIEEDPIRTFQGEATPYGIAKVQADLLNDAGTHNIKVCIPDTGIDINHEDFNASWITGEVSNTLTVEMDIGEWNEDSYGHGTHMAGTVAAIGGNNVGTVGVNPGGHINLHMVKIVDNPGWWPFRGSDMIAAVDRCRAAGANIINMSISGQKSSLAEQQAMQAAYDAGVIMVAAAGQRGGTGYSYPASYDSVISVAATDQNDDVWAYSHSNDQVELSAPGMGIRSTVPNNQYANWDGTSISSAYVSGAVALVWSHHPECSNSEIRNILNLTAKDLGSTGRDATFGHGLIQAQSAVNLIDLGGCDGIINNTPTISGTPFTSVHQDVPYSFTPTFSDADEADTLTLSMTNIPSWASFDAETGILNGTPGNADVGIYSNMVITVTDNGGASASLPAFNLEVININDAPVITTDPVTTVEQDSAYNYVVSADDIDVNTTLTYSATQLPAWLSFDAQSRTLSGTPGNDEVGEHSVQLRVSDGETAINQSFTITVNNVNDAPQLTGSPDISVNENRNYLFAPSATDPDNDSLTYSISGKPAWATFDAASGQLSGNPGGIGSIKHDNIVISVSDGTLTDDVQFSITVVPSVYSGWSNSAEAANHTTWTPAAANQTTDFSQSRSYQQSQSRTEQQQQLDNSTLQLVNVGAPIVHTRTLDQSESRSVTVSVSGWSNSGSESCGVWAPAESTVEYGVGFTQSQNCSQDQVRTWSYVASAGTIHSRNEGQNNTYSRFPQCHRHQTSLAVYRFNLYWLDQHRRSLQLQRLVTFCQFTNQRVQPIALVQAESISL